MSARILSGVDAEAVGVDAVFVAVAVVAAVFWIVEQFLDFNFFVAWYSLKLEQAFDLDDVSFVQLSNKIIGRSCNRSSQVSALLVVDVLVVLTAASDLLWRLLFL